MQLIHITVSNKGYKPWAVQVIVKYGIILEIIFSNQCYTN